MLVEPLFLAPSESDDSLVKSVHLKISVEVSVPNVPRSTDNVPQYFILESLDYYNITVAGTTP